MLRTGQGLQAMLDGRTHELARAWKIERRDGVIFRFVDTNEVIRLVDGEEYTPIDGIAATALSKEVDFGDESNLDARGIISHDTITHEDVRAGKFNGAVVIEYVVNRATPWYGNLIENNYSIVETRLNRTVWQVQFAGTSAKMRQANGFILSRVCRNNLGDGNCLFPLSFDAGTVTFVAQDRLEFGTNLLNTQSNDYYKYGEVKFTSGNNNAAVFNVKKYRDSDGRFWLRTKAPLDIQSGDSFEARRGCPKTLLACDQDFSNTPNNGSYPAIPGGDSYGRSPDFV